MYDDDVAPLITLPSRNHCTLVVTDAGSHVPVLTRRVEPTRTVPDTVGRVTFTTARGKTMSATVEGTASFAPATSVDNGLVLPAQKPSTKAALRALTS